MSDIQLILDEEDFIGEFVVEANDLAVDEGLETAVIVSLFTDARAPDDVPLPDGSDDKRGFWGDSVGDDDEDITGSLLWTLEREKQRTQITRRAEQYSEDALKWMVEDRVAAKVTATAEIVQEGMLGIQIVIERPTGDSVQYKYEYAWQQQAFRRV